MVGRKNLFSRSDKTGSATVAAEFVLYDCEYVGLRLCENRFFILCRRRRKIFTARFFRASIPEGVAGNSPRGAVEYVHSRLRRTGGKFRRLCGWNENRQ